jgi:hypothetical protein
MNADEQNLKTSSEDIDLLVLLERGILFLSRYKWVFIIAATAGLGLGLFFYLSLPKVYQSRLIVHSYLLANQEEIQIVDNWNELLKKKEYPALAAAFHCRENILYPLKKIKADEIQKVFTTTNPNGFSIEVTVTNNDILPDLQNAIVYGLENGEYVRDRIAIKRTNLQELIGKTSQEIGKLDSTKQVVEKIIRGNEKPSSSLIVDGSGINRQLIEMNEKLLSFKEGLQFADAVQVLQGFSRFKQPSGPKLSVWLLIGLFLGLSLGYLYALVHSVKAKLKARSAQRSL